MLNIKQRVQNERGSASIEFLGMVPYVFLMMVMIWQMVVGVFAYITIQSAANEAAKVYSTTHDRVEAHNAGSRIVSSLKHVVVQQNEIVDLSDRQFRSIISIDLSLVFLPEEFLGMNIPTIPITQIVDGRKI